ncbi:MAG: phosphatidylserine decarboxylase family protein [Deltaproteobacteria bacterium]|jgi:phosphatidylserine decarboxylase|nr:phosphatidylserine decarboxylase family protein [Deltaproteobacteria bacterium]
MLEDIFKARIPRFNIENRLPVARPGIVFIIGFAALTLVLWCLGLNCLAFLVLLLTLMTVWFYRDPKRPTPPGDFGLSPCDGTVIRLDPEAACPLTGQEALKVSVFMDIFSVHVNRAPISGSLVRQDYFKGSFVNASFDKASAQNERNAIVIEDSHGRRVTVVQIAGLVARRIVSWVNPGDKLSRGQRFGMIRFGSRVDLYLPRSVEIMVALGQKVQAGWSPIWRHPEGS